MNTNHCSTTQIEISRHWLDMLEENHVRYIALDPQHDAVLIEQLQTRPEWLVEFANEEAIFFVRDEMAEGN
jgi:hypothetical protein